MLRMTVELWPHGDIEKRSVLLTADIWNDGTGSFSVGNYGYHLSEGHFREHRSTMVDGEIKDFPRQKAVSKLIALVLEDYARQHECNER